MLSNSIIERISKRLASEPEWAASELGKSLALTIDLKIVSLKVMADYLTESHRTLYRCLDSKSGQFQLKPKYRKSFNKRCQLYRQALQAAYDANAFNEFNWAGGRGNSPRDEAHTILLDHTPEDSEE